MSILANTDTSFLTLFLGLIGLTLALILIVLTIMMPVYVYRIYKQGVEAKKMADVKFKILNRMMVAMESINAKMGQ